jgi:predicted nucleic acid-binding protein
MRLSGEVRKSEGLLTNDSLVVAGIRAQGLTKVATANGDFDRASEITVYKPTDLDGGEKP